MNGFEAPRQFAGAHTASLRTPGSRGVAVPAPVWERPSDVAKPIRLPGVDGPRPAVAAAAKKVKSVKVIDSSGSEYGSFGDPTGIRFAAAKSLIELQRRSGGGRAGVVHWGSDAPSSMVTSALDVTKNKKQLDRALTIPQSLCGTNLASGLRRAAEVLLPLDADDIPLVFVISDGLEIVTTAIHEAVNALPPGSVHYLLLDRSNQLTPDMELSWATVAFGSWNRLTHLDTRALATQIAEIYANALGFPLSTATTSTNTKKENTK